MGLVERDRVRDEKINGVIYDMSPAPHFRHGMINSNIHTIIKYGLKDSICIVSMENLDFKYQPDINDDYLCPDIMVICDRKHLKGGTYSGVPRFVAETLSPSTAKRDRGRKRTSMSVPVWRSCGLYLPESGQLKSIILRAENIF